MELNNVTNDKQVKGLASGTTQDHIVTFGADGYTIQDSGKTLADTGKIDSVSINNTPITPDANKNVDIIVTSDNNTAAWGSAVTVGAVGGVNLKFTMPANPDTDTWRPVTVDGTAVSGTLALKGVATSGKYEDLSGRVTYSYDANTKTLTINTNN